MTLLDTERLIRKISDFLQQGGNTDVAPRLAEDYAAACHAVNLRLQQCEAMIRANDRHQAIQLAETAPNLLALISILDFRNANDWRAYCQQNALAAPERMDSRAIQTLNQCYAQGVSTDHPLYAAYRKAVLNRDDEAALNTLRSITRVNPSDTNAASELMRVDAKVLATRLEHLGQTLVGGDAASVAAEAEEIELTHFQPRPDGEVWRKASLIRCSVLLEETASAKAAAQWATASEELQIIRRLQKDLALELPASELQQLESLEKWVQGEQEKDRKNREFNAVLSELHRRIHESEEKDTSARYVELPEMRADFEALHKTWRALTDFTRPIPEDATTAFRKRSGLLEAEIARRMALKRRMLFASVAAVLLVGAVIVWFVLGQMKARQFARDLESAVSQRQTRVAERLLETAHTTGKRMLNFGKVNVAVADAESFVAKEHALLDNFNTAFAKLPTQLSGEPDAAGVGAIGNQLAQTRAALNALSPDLKTENEPRLGAFERQWQPFLSDAATAANNRLDKWVGDAEKQCAELDYRSAADAAKRLSSFSAVLKKINECEAGFTNYVALRGDLIQRAAIVQSKAEAYERELKKLNDGFAALKEARAFTNFSSAINTMASSEFSTAPAAVAARSVQSLDATEDATLRLLLNATNAATWAFIKKTKSPDLIPQVVMPVERKLFEELKADPAVNGDHEHYVFWLDPNGTKRMEWITAGPLDASLGWKQIKAWAVTPDATTATFEDHDYGSFNGTWKLSATQTIYHLDQATDSNPTAALGAAELGKVWTGGDTYVQPLLASLDAVKNSDKGSPIFRAYLLCQLVELMEFQPDEWGLSFCPSARADVAEIHKLVGGKIESGDWFVPSKINAWTPKLEQFFANAKSVSYAKQAAGNLALAQAVARSGLHYVGFINLDAQPVLADSQTPKDLWGYDAVSKRPVPASGSVMPLSPLFALTVPRADYLANAGIDPKAPSFAGGLLPLFRAKN